MAPSKRFEINEHDVMGLAQLYPGGCSLSEAADYLHVPDKQVRGWIIAGRHQKKGIRFQLARAIDGKFARDVILRGEE